MKTKRFIAILLATLCLLFQTACSDNKDENTSNLIKISVTIAPQKEFVSRIAGDKAEINVIVPTGSDPENYDPSISDIKSFSDSELYFTIGVPSEENSILPMISEKTSVIHLEAAVSSEIPDLYIGSERDPHIWLSAERVKLMAQTIKNTLCELDPENAEFYRKNSEEYIAELSDAEEYASETLSGLKNRSIIVFHPAFGYFADEHNLTMYALEDEGKEATPKELAALIDFAKENNIKAIFYQEESSGKQAETFANEIGGEAVMLSPLSESYTESYRLTADKIKEFDK